MIDFVGCVQLVASSQTFNGDDFASITMVSPEQPHADEMEERVNALSNSVMTSAPVDVEKVVMHKYATVAYGDEEDEEDEDSGFGRLAAEDVVEETDRESESSESLDEAEKATIALMKEQMESQKEITMEAAAMKEALKSMESVDGVGLLGVSASPRHIKQQHSGLIKDLDLAEIEFTEHELIQQKQEMQQQMAHLMLESRKSVTPKVSPQATPVKMFEPETAGTSPFAVIDQSTEEEVVLRTKH